MAKIVRVVYFPHMWWTENSLCNLGIAVFRLMVKEHDKFIFLKSVVKLWKHQIPHNKVFLCAIRKNFSRDIAGHIICLSWMRKGRQWMAWTSLKNICQNISKTWPVAARSCLTQPSLDVHHCLPVIHEVRPMSIYFCRPLVSTGFKLWLGDVRTAVPMVVDIWQRIFWQRYVGWGKGSGLRGTCSKLPKLELIGLRNSG